ncbi:MAG: dihydrodipicolinate reductase C-terminal domain-containing protein [Longimicrobiales bacterium]|nr:dihydrodipicolinate reductase C-terminal domain-containing protein [Longimicrobiales bacterium]
MKLLLIGYGAMGRTVERLALEAGHEVMARVGRADPRVTEAGEAEVAIEFAGPSGAPTRIREATSAGLPVVSGSTGWDDDFAAVAAHIREVDGALLHAPNLSIGVAIFERIVRRAATLLDAVPDYAIELEETHHTRKIDHPSGTARWLASSVVERVDRIGRWAAELVTADEISRGAGAEAPGSGDGHRTDVVPSTKERLPIRCVREGDVPGTHTLRASGPDDILELTHRALGRDGFARGAIRAAEWLRGRRGVYTLDEMIDALLPPPDR